MTVKIDIRKRENVGIDDNSLFISFPYNQSLVDTVRSFPMKHWDAKNKEWEIPFNKLAEFIEKASDFEIEINADEYVSLTKREVKMPKGFEFKTKPFEHQIDGFNYGLNHDRWLLADEQGLGKTKQVIDIAVAKKLQYKISKCLIICCVNGLKYNWQNEISIHSNETGYILGNRNGKVKGNKEKLADLENIDDIDSYFIITNIESIRDESIQTKISELCKSGKIGIIAVDEVHKCKDPTSQQGKALLKLEPKVRIAMTGTPVMNQPIDLFIILKWLGYESHAFYSFKKHYCEYGGYGGYEIIGYKNLDELGERLNEIMLRRLKNDVLDLPEKLYIDEFVELTPKQLQIYKEVTADIQANIDQIKKASNPLAELIRMRQATGYTGILSSSIRESAKLDRMEELVEEAVANGKKVVIFSNWTQMTTPIRERLEKKYYCVSITGELNAEARETAKNEFQNNPKCKVIIGTTGAMGTGLTLTAGTVEIFMDEPWNRANKEQAEDRCHRVGTKENVTIYTLLAKNTIDERIHQLVYKKGAMADMLVDGKLTVNKEEVIDFLLS